MNGETSPSGSLFHSQLIFLNALDMLCIAGFDGYFKVLNPSWSVTLGYSEQELLSRPWIEFVHPDDREDTNNIGSVLIDGQKVYQFENRYICKDGSVRWLSWNSFPDSEKGVMFGVARDVTEAKCNEERVQVLTEQNALLLTELRHRVKNNLAVVSGLIELEAAAAPSTDTADALNKVVMRLQAMAGVYDRLGPGRDGSTIEFSSYLSQLINGVHDTYNHHTITLSYEYQKSPLFLDAKCVFNLGFIVTELLTNAVKYAYPGTAAGEIRVRLRADEQRCEHSVEDDGVGMPEGFDPRDSTGTGMMVVQALVGQLNGEIVYKSEGGTKATVRVPVSYAPTLA